MMRDLIIQFRKSSIYSTKPAGAKITAMGRIMAEIFWGSSQTPETGNTGFFCFWRWTTEHSKGVRPAFWPSLSQRLS
jgi:hypothetical protein